jgi:hypothetical protein
MLRLRVGFVVTALALSLPALAAQQPKAGPSRGGQWLGLGVGSGWGRVTCAICESNRTTSITGYVKAGGTLNRRFLLGVEADGWMRSADNVDEFLIGLAAQLIFYPNPRKRLFYKAGAGMMLYQIDDGPGRLTSTAFGPSVGAGYDLPVSPNVSFTPFASAFIASLGGEIKFNGERLRNDGGLTLIQLGVGVTWH